MTIDLDELASKARTFERIFRAPRRGSMHPSFVHPQDLMVADAFKRIAEKIDGYASSSHPPEATAGEHEGSLAG